MNLFSSQHAHVTLKCLKLVSKFNNNHFFFFFFHHSNAKEWNEKFSADGSWAQSSVARISQIYFQQQNVWTNKNEIKILRRWKKFLGGRNLVLIVELWSVNGFWTMGSNSKLIKVDLDPIEYFPSSVYIFQHKSLVLCIYVFIYIDVLCPWEL